MRYHNSSVQTISKDLVISNPPFIGIIHLSVLELCVLCVLCGLIIPMQPELILHIGVQKPGFYEKRRCNQQIRKKTRFRGVGVRKSRI